MADIPKTVSQRLQARATSLSHPDLNVLGAFAEKSLREEEQDRVLEHLAQCADCREIIFLSNPEAVASTTVVTVPARSNWLRGSALRWGAVAACSIIVGTAVTLRYRVGSESAPSQTETSVAVSGSNSNELQPIVPAPAVAEKKEEKVIEPSSSVATAKVARPAAAEPKRDFGRLASSDAKQLQAGAANNRADAVIATLPSTSSPAALDKIAPTVEMADAVPAKAKDAGAEPASPAVQGFAGNLKLAPMRVVNAPSPQASAPLIPRWTLSADGALQRSFDSGKTWETIAVPGKAVFRALAAVDSDIWLGGSSGSLYHSADAGQHWIQVQPVADGQALTADIIGVEFTDARQGKLTTANHEIWTTADGGQNWHKDKD